MAPPWQLILYLIVEDPELPPDVSEFPSLAACTVAQNDWDERAYQWRRRQGFGIPGTSLSVCNPVSAEPALIGYWTVDGAEIRKVDSR